jgi:hypothetical protein
MIMPSSPAATATQPPVNGVTIGFAAFLEEVEAAVALGIATVALLPAELLDPPLVVLNPELVVETVAAVAVVVAVAAPPAPPLPPPPHPAS